MKTNQIIKQRTKIVKKLNSKLEGKNAHSVYTLCYECHTWQIGLPGQTQCGDCGSKDTMTFYDAITVDQAITQAVEEGRQQSYMEIIEALPETKTIVSKLMNRGIDKLTK